MRAVCYVHAYVPHHNAGAETTMHDLNRALVDAGWEVTVLLSRESNQRPGAPVATEPYSIDGVTVIPYRDKHQAGALFPLADVILTHLDASERAALLGANLGRPVVQVVHNTMWQTEGYLSLGCDLAVYNTEWVREHHDAHRDSPVASIASAGQITLTVRKASQWEGVVVHPPIDASAYRLPRNPPSRRKYVTLVNLWGGAGGETGKGPHVLYALAKEMPDVHFMGVVGGYGEQDVREISNVTIVDHTSDIAKDVYGKTRVLLMPSKYESFGRVAIEGGASGIPTIANPTPGLLEALGPDGLYCPLDDLDAWKRTLRSLLDSPETYRAASVYASERSAYWTARRQTELAEFVSAVHRTVARKG